MGRILDLFINKYNYTDFHELNLDWIISDLRTLAETLENFININTIKYANPIQWNITTQYEANTVVIDANDGTAYLSVKPVPSGVALSNTDYWTPIFTLNLLSANQNITFRDDGSNVLATFASDTDDWLIWNSKLYKVSRPIAINEAYVVGYNLERYSVEQFIKDYIDIVTNDLTTLANTVGDLDDLNTDDKTSIVNAINSILSDTIGDLTLLNTSDKTSVVNAINEITDIYVTPEMFGAKGDGVTDDTTAFTNMIATEKPIKFTPNKIYKIDGVVTADIEFIGIDGNHSKIDGGQFVFNVSGGSWTRPYPVPYSYIKNVTFINPSERPNLQAIKSGLPIDFDTVKFNRYTVCFEKIGAYLDHVSMKNCYVFYPLGDDYRIKVQGLGDDSYFESCAFEGSKTLRGISLNGAYFVNCLQGNYYFTNSHASFMNCHMESTHGVTLEDDFSMADFYGCTFWQGTHLPTKNSTYNGCKLLCSDATNEIDSGLDWADILGDNISMAAASGAYPKSICENKMFDLTNCPDTSHYTSLVCISNYIKRAGTYHSWLADLATYNYTIYPSSTPFSIDGCNAPVAKYTQSIVIDADTNNIEFFPNSYVIGTYLHVYREHSGVIEFVCVPISKGTIFDFGNNVNGYRWKTVSAIPTPSASSALFLNGSYFKGPQQPNATGYLWLDTNTNTVKIS